MKNIKTYEDFVNEEINLRKGLMGAALGAGLAFSNTANSQDVKTTNVIKPPEYVATPYDSTSNYVNPNNYKGSYNSDKKLPEIKKIIGQTIFLKPLDYKGNLVEKYGGEGIEMYKDTTIIKKNSPIKQETFLKFDYDLFKVLIGKKIKVKTEEEKKKDFSLWSEFDITGGSRDIYGREFTVVDVVKKLKYRATKVYYYCLELIDDNGKTSFYDLTSNLGYLHMSEVSDVYHADKTYWPFSYSLKDILIDTKPDIIVPNDTIQKYEYLDYKTLIGKYFEVIDVIKIRHFHHSEEFICLKLKEVGSNNIYYYKYPSKEEYFPFVIGGFYVKQTQLLTNSYLIISTNTGSTSNFSTLKFKLKKGSKTIKSNIYTVRPVNTPGGESDSKYPIDLKLKLGDKLVFDGLIVDVNQSKSPLCAVYKIGDKKVIITLSEIFKDDEEEFATTGLYYPGYYTPISVNFYINVNVYR